MGGFIVCEHLSKFYLQGPNRIRALSDCTFSVDRGECVALMGPSGCGKTTLLNSLALLVRPDSGTYSFQGELVAAWNERRQSEFRNRKIGFVVQDFALLEHESAVENVLLPLLYSAKKSTRTQRRNHALRMLERVEMGACGSQIVRTLSGGQRQRVAIARALVNDPEIILADEPTGALDTENQEQVMRILLEWVGEGKTLIMATHNPDLAGRCSRIVRMLDGSIYE